MAVSGNLNLITVFNKPIVTPVLIVKALNRQNLYRYGYKLNIFKLADIVIINSIYMACT